MMRRSLLALICVSILAGCSKSEEPDDGKFDASRLPRVSGSKQIFANAEVTNFTAPLPVAQTADDLEKILGAAGWQKYTAPNTAQANDPSMRIMSFKKGPYALNVFIGIAAAQNNSTSVQYSALPL